MTPKTRRRASKKQEQKLAERLGGRAQPGSGAVPGCKGDVRVPGRLCGEAKYTTKKTYRLALADLLKIQCECQGLEKPVFIIEFKNEQTLKGIAAYAIVPLGDWEDMFNAEADED